MSYRIIGFKNSGHLLPSKVSYVNEAKRSSHLCESFFLFNLSDLKISMQLANSSTGYQAHEMDSAVIKMAS